MKKNYLLILTVVLLFSACSHPGPDLSKASQKDLFWSIIKSPITGKCYETATHEHGTLYQGFGYMGMSEIPCELQDK